jgi:hypothetical protein
MDVRLGDRTVGRIPFSNGIDRDVYEDAEGRQYIHGAPSLGQHLQGYLFSASNSN